MAANHTAANHAGLHSPPSILAAALVHHRLPSLHFASLPCAAATAAAHASAAAPAVLSLTASPSPYPPSSPPPPPCAAARALRRTPLLPWPPFCLWSTRLMPGQTTTSCALTTQCQVGGWVGVCGGGGGGGAGGRWKQQRQIGVQSTHTGRRDGAGSRSKLAAMGLLRTRDASTPPCWVGLGPGITQARPPQPALHRWGTTLVFARSGPPLNRGQACPLSSPCGDPDPLHVGLP